MERQPAFGPAGLASNGMFMKRIIIGTLAALVVVAILAVVALGLLLERGIKAGVETVGSKVTGVAVRLESVSLSLLSGSGQIKGLIVGNPPGFKTPWAINIGAASLVLEPRSLLSDKIIIKSINVQQPEITFETDLRANNLNQILANAQATAGSRATPAATPAPAAQPRGAKASKKLQVNDFTIKGGKIHLSVAALGGQSATVTLPDIHLADLGQGPEGITAAELTQRVLEMIEKEASQASAGKLAGMGKEALKMAKGLGKGDTNSVEKVTRGLGELFKKK